MTDPNNSTTDPTQASRLEGLLAKLDNAIEALNRARDFAKIQHLNPVLDLTRRVLLTEGGFDAIESRAERLERAGVFNDTDWAYPQILIPSLASASLRSGESSWVILEAISELRMLAVAQSRYWHPHLSSEQAHHFLSQVMALNLELLFGAPSEAEREIQGRLADISRGLFQHFVNRIGFEHIIDELIEEIWRILNQRPIQVDSVVQMITHVAICRQNPEINFGPSGQGAERLVSSLYMPTRGCQEDPGLSVYEDRLRSMDNQTLHNEAVGFARAMHDTGLVSPYHSALLRFLEPEQLSLLSEALGLSATGRDCLLCYSDLVQELINKAIKPATAQAMYGLSQMLERGILYHPAMAPALWRQLALPLSDNARQRLILAYGDQTPPEDRLLAGVLMLLGQPFGIGQGNNPTCQSARALSMWSNNDPDYLLQIVAWAARDDEIIMHFEGKPVSSTQREIGVASTLMMDLDPVSLLVVPHLDRIYAEMIELCADREGDPHRWVNPEFHGWWTGRSFFINVDVETGHIIEPESFYRHFYAYYHPYYNGNQPLVHPQPAGIAVTDSAGRFIGWHAITILRVALDPAGVMRVYFFNPNNDSGQDWGLGVVVSTAGLGERYGEASLPFEQFASRLYIYHFDPLEKGKPESIPADSIHSVIELLENSWGAERIPA
ncbi:hypothetical protein [Saccharospirillum salsuginis]|uniref:Uncharacterized protein n=1 Tax=Saccharospirillum salsuginis TaxID=418750 RepID=A0A918K6J1_9GAMM|nr:hypothetical protein [Saccharospirillum salsuginis]GGX52112.1 hypothetical protein GCM10007392_19300 [Saccharospirillum salsuginis]